MKALPLSQTHPPLLNQWCYDRNLEPSVLTDGHFMRRICYIARIYLFLFMRRLGALLPAPCYRWVVAVPISCDGTSV